MELEKKVPVVLAGRDFVVKQVPMARVKRLGPALAQILASVDPQALQDPTQLGSVLAQLLEAPHVLLSLFIDELPLDIFQDEVNGVTFPEIVAAFDVATRVNRLDILKNLWARLQQAAPKTSA